MQGGVVILGAIIFGLFAVFLVVLCFSFIFAFISNKVWRFGICDDFIWWDSPRWPRSKGSIPLADVCKIKIWEGLSKLDVTMKNGTSQRIPCFVANRHLNEILNNHYPSVAVEFIEGAD
jgi:hypothetical protein